MIENLQETLRKINTVPDGIRAFKMGANAFMDGMEIEENPFVKMHESYSHLIYPWNCGYQVAADKGLSR